MNKKILLASITGLILSSSTIYANAETFENWTFFNKDNKCWIQENPMNENSNKKFIAIMNDTNENIKGSFVAVSGNDNTAKGDAKIIINKTINYDTLTFNNAAFVSKGEIENNLINDMIKGSLLEIEWNVDNIKQLDQYSLKGLNAAKKFMDNKKECK